MSHSDHITAVDTTLRIISALQELDGARVTQLSDHLGVGKSTVYRHLVTLKEHGYVTKEGDVYVLGLKFLKRGQYVQHRKQVYRVARPIVAELASETGERCQFVVAENGRGVYVHVASGERAVETDSDVGQRFDLHATACGKAILAHIPDTERDAIIERRGLPAITDSTVTDEATLRDELADVRARGYAYNREGRVSGLCSVGVPVLGAAGQVLGALSVSGPAGRMQGEWYTETLPNTLLGAADEITLKLQYP